MGKKKRKPAHSSTNKTHEQSKTSKQKKSKKDGKPTKVKSKDTKMKFKYKHPKLSIALKIMLILIIILLVIAAGVCVGLFYGLWGDDISIDLSDLVLKENSVIVDEDGNIIEELSGDENRKIVTLEEMTPYLPKAYISIEDERFEQHHGIDIKRTGAAIISFVTHGGKSTAGGGSTITQQLVKNITQEKESKGINGVVRKVKEWTRAYQIEEVMSKDQIIELYLNLIFIGGKNQNCGVEIAAEYYFNTTAKDLSIAQCAFLAGINHSPNRYNPYFGDDPTEKINKRTKTVLSQMKKFDYITQEQYDEAVAEVDAGFKFENGAKGNVYSSHTDALLEQLIEQIMEEKQISKDAATTYLYSSGLRIYSTQVESIQKVMEAEAKDSKYNLKSKTTKDENGNYVLAQAAAVVIDPKTGYVVGAVGQLGEKTTSRGLNRINSLRQTGSSIKPLVDVLPGIEEGKVTPATIYADLATVFGKTYDPKNYNSFTGLRTVRTALATSQNIPFIKIMAEVTPKKSIEYLEKMGVSSLDEKDNNLSLAIGGLTYGISPLEMAAGYACIANDGVYIEPTFYSKVEDSNGKVVLETGQKTEKVCSVETAYIMKNLLQSVVKGADGYAGTASYCAIKGMDLAAKTGTTNDVKDRWLCGFTNYYACAVYYGFDKPERISLSSSRSSGLMFKNIMTSIHKGLEPSTFKEPENIVHATVCRVSGRLATDKCSNTYTEVFLPDHLPESCDAHQNQYTICTQTGKLANEFCPSRENRTANYVVEKERLGLWTTSGLNTTMGTEPTEYCTEHKKVEVIVPPIQEPEIPEEPENNNDDENNEKPNTGTEEPEKPDTGDTGETGENTTGGEGTGDNSGDNPQN